MLNFPVTAERELTPAAALQLAFDLFELGESVTRQNLRREHPEADEKEIERLLVVWLHSRPGAELGDSSGLPCDRLLTRS